MRHNPHPATPDKIAKIVGPVDAPVLMRIVETRATAAEVFEAFAWATGEDQLGTALERAAGGLGLGSLAPTTVDLGQ